MVSSAKYVSAGLAISLTTPRNAPGARAVGNVFTEQLQPRRAQHDLEVALEAGMHL